MIITAEGLGDKSSALHSNFMCLISNFVFGFLLRIVNVSHFDQGNHNGH